MNADERRLIIMKRLFRLFFSYLRLCSRRPWRSPSLALGPASLRSTVQFLLRAKLSAFIICGFAFLSVQVSAEPVTEDPLERQVLDIGKDLRCAVCQNQPISESNADLARDMRDIIREQLQAAQTRGGYGGVAHAGGLVAGCRHLRVCVSASPAQGIPAAGA
jgi:hypothetical protein